MIIGLFHKGSGIGNQLHRYVATRVKALDVQEPFGMIGDFKGRDFMNLDVCDVEYPAGKIETDDYPTIIDGEFQGEHVWKHRENEVREWLKVEPLEVDKDVCIIGFRGGEYVGVRDLFLPKEYWEQAILIMRNKYPNIRFEVHTDDINTAQMFFPDFKCISNASINWRAIRYAKHLIIANSSFYIFPALLGDAEEIIAPKYWAGYNKGYWQLEDNQYARFTYI